MNVYSLAAVLTRIQVLYIMTDKYIENNPIRVLQVVDKCAMRGAPIHGVSRLLLTWWPAFIDSEVVLSLCILRGETGCDDFTKAGIYVEDLNRSKMDPRTIFDLMKIIKRDKIQILHCHGYGATTFGRVAGLLSRTPVIVHEHMVDESIPWYQKLVDKVLSPFTAKGVAISIAVKTFMTGPRAISEKRMKVIYNCVPDEYFSHYSNEQKAAIAKKYGIPKEKNIVGIIGRLDPVKGHADFLIAAAEVLKVIPDTCFVIVGEGELREQLERLAGDLGIAGDVMFLGHSDKVVEIISLFDLLVASSYSEGFSLAIAEAMAQGKAVVATAVGGIPEVVEHGKNGILVPAKSPYELAGAITMVLKDDELRERLGCNGLQQCRKRFMVSGTAKLLQALYVELL